MTSILVVEDENIVAMDLSATLRRLGFTVCAMSARGEEAVELARNLQPDLILMDVMLGGPMDGVRAADLIRAERDVPIVFLTAYTDDKTIARAARTGPYGFIVKPFHDRDIKSAVEVALHKYRTDRERVGGSAQLVAVQSARDAIVTCDVERRVVSLNAAAERLAGTTSAAAAGRPFGEILRLVFTDGDAGVDPLAQMLATRLPVLLPQHARLAGASGREIAVEGCVSPIAGSSGRLVGAAVVLRASADGRRLEARVRLADRLAAVGVVAAELSHEIDEALAYLSANLDFSIAELGRGVADTAQVGEALKEARHGAERIARVASQFRASARAADTQPEVVELGPILELATSVAWAKIGDRARLVQHLSPAPDVQVEALRLAATLVALLLRAARSAREEGAVVALSSSTRDGRAVIEITDNGAQLATEAMDLAMARNSIGDMGCTLTATYITGSGNRVTLTLPPAEPRAADRRPRLVVVDDEPLVRGVIQRSLADEFEITSLSSAREALTRFVAGERWDAWLMDLLMPDMTGMDLYDEIAKLAPDQAAHFVFLTGGAFTRRATDFLAEPGRRYVEKPFDPTELRRLIRDAMGEHRPTS